MLGKRYWRSGLITAIGALVLGLAAFGCGPVKTTISVTKAEKQINSAKYAAIDEEDYRTFFSKWCSSRPLGFEEETWTNICKVQGSCLNEIMRSNYYCRKAIDIFIDNACATMETHRKFCYYYYRALEYYNKAKEEEGYSEFEHAIDFGKKAEAFAKKAEKIGEDELANKARRRIEQKGKSKKKVKVKRSSEEDILEEDDQ